VIFERGVTLSYTKFSKEVTKWLKANGLPCYGTANDSPEETKARMDAWMRGSKEVLHQWITGKRYRELISCARGGWYQDIETIRNIDVPSYVAGRSYSHLGEIAKYRKRALDQIIRYTGYLELIHAPAEYLEQVTVLQKSVSDLTIKTKDLKPFRFRLAAET